MGAFGRYVAALAAAEAAGSELPRLEEAVLDDLLRRYTWFTAARLVRALQQGTADPRLAVGATSRTAGTLALQHVEAAALTGFSPDELLERFLGCSDLRIVASDEGPEGEVRLEAELADEDDLVSEELAEIYLAQGLCAEAMATYRKLSLLNPEKSVYFAKIIERIETNN